jgi:hypothetical protein
MECAALVRVKVDEARSNEVLAASIRVTKFELDHKTGCTQGGQTNKLTWTDAAMAMVVQAATERRLVNCILR